MTVMPLTVGTVEPLTVKLWTLHGHHTDSQALDHLRHQFRELSQAKGPFMALMLLTVLGQREGRESEGAGAGSQGDAKHRLRGEVSGVEVVWDGEGRSRIHLAFRLFRRWVVSTSALKARAGLIKWIRCSHMPRGGLKQGIGIQNRAPISRLLFFERPRT